MARLLQCQQDAQRFASTREQRAQQEINVVLNAADESLRGLLRQRRDFGATAYDVAIMRYVISDAADAIERQLALARGVR